MAGEHRPDGRLNPSTIDDDKETPMKRLTRTALLATTLIAGLVATAAQAGGGCQRHHDIGSEARINRLAEHLELSAAQRDKVRAIVDQSRPAMRAVHDKMRDNRQAMRALMQQEKPADNEIRRLAEARGKLVAEMAVLRARMKSDIHAVLTPEQRDKLKQHMEQRRSRHGHSPAEATPGTAGQAS
jgi:protein CpxP